MCTCVHLVVQLRLTLCNPMDSSPPGSFVHGDSPGKNTGEGKNLCPHPGDLPNPGIESRSQIPYHLSHQGSPVQMDSAAGWDLHSGTTVGRSMVCRDASAACSSTKLHVLSLFQSDVHAEAPQILASS